MALSDPFSQTYTGSYEAGTSLGKGLQTAATAFAKPIEEKKKQEATLNLLQQMGIIKPAEPTLKDYEQEAGKLGVTQFKSLEKAPESERLHFAKQMWDVLKLPHPKPTGLQFDYDAAKNAGVSWSPTSGDVILSPKKQEKTLLEQLTEAETAKQAGYDYKAGKVQSKGASGGYGAAQLQYAEKNAKQLADAVQSGDYAAVASLSRTALTPVVVELVNRGENVTEAMLGYKAQQYAMSSAKIQEQKIQNAVSAQTLLDSSYDPKTGNYNVPPSQHVELALATARMLSQTGVVPYEMVQELRQMSGREALASVLIYAGANPAEVGGSTQSIINMFAKLIEREGLASQSMLENLKSGKTTDFRKILEQSKSKKQGKSITDTTGITNSSNNNIPSVGGVFNGERVTKVTRIR